MNGCHLPLVSPPLVTGRVPVIQSTGVGRSEESLGATDVAPLDCRDKPGNEGERAVDH